jgi:hypothetical protein
MYTIKKQIFQGDCTLETLCECNIIRIYPRSLLLLLQRPRRRSHLKIMNNNPIDGIAGSVKFEFWNTIMRWGLHVEQAETECECKNNFDTSSQLPASNCQKTNAGQSHPCKKSITSCNDVRWHLMVLCQEYQGMSEPRVLWPKTCNCIIISVILKDLGSCEVCGGLVARVAGSNAAEGMDVCLLCFYVVLSSVRRGLCDGLITRPEESYRASNCMCDQ